MKSDPLFFGLFKDLPSCFFQLVGRSAHDAERYVMESIEYKDASVRLDGLYRPLHPEIDQAYIWEAQFYPSDTVYANLFAKIGHFLQRGNTNQDWIAVVIYPHRAMEQENLHPYRCLLNSDQLIRIYLEDLPPAEPDQFELGILELIVAKPEVALAKAQTMVPSLRKSKRSKQFQRLVIQFIETIILHQFPTWSRAEIEKMLQVTDVRQTRVFQEALEEGREEGREEALEKVARQLLDMGRPISEIAKATGMTAAQIRKLKKKSSES